MGNNVARRRLPHGEKTTPGRNPRAFTRVTTAQQEQLLEMFLTRWVDKHGRPGHGMTDRQIANRMGMGFRTVGSYKKLFCQQHPDLEARIKGAVTDGVEYTTLTALAALSPEKLAEEAVAALRDHAAPGFKTAHREEETRQLHDAIRAAKPGETLSVDGMLGILSSLAQTAPAQYKVQAIKLLDELQATHRPAATFGPPRPITEEERVARLSRLMTAVGPDTTLSALRNLWPSMSLSDGSTHPLTSISTLIPCDPDPLSPASSKPEGGSSPTSPTTSGSEWTGGSSTDESAASTKSRAHLSNAFPP